MEHAARAAEACHAVSEPLEARVRKNKKEADELASALELYASVLSAIHDEKNDEVRGGERCDS